MYWQLYNGGDDLWNSISCDDPSVYNSINWSKHLSNSGWSCYRFQCVNKNNDISYIQSFIKLYPFAFGLVWIPGGVIGSKQNISTLNKSIRKELNLSHCYIRLRSHMIYQVDHDIHFLLNKWRKPLFEFNSGLTMILNLDLKKEDIYKGLNRTWKRAINKFDKHNLKLNHISDPIDIDSLYMQLKCSKNLKSFEVYDFFTIKSLIDIFKHNIIILGVYNNSSQLIALRGAIIYKNQALDIFAAANDVAKSKSLSNFLFLELIKKCKDIGCRSYNLNGISPLNSPGVYLFKKGTGAMPVKLLGEYESSSSLLLSLIINLSSFLRRSF